MLFFLLFLAEFRFIFLFLYLFFFLLFLPILTLFLSFSSAFSSSRLSSCLPSLFTLVLPSSLFFSFSLPSFLFGNLFPFLLYFFLLFFPPATLRLPSPHLLSVFSVPPPPPPPPPVSGEKSWRSFARIFFPQSFMTGKLSCLCPVFFPLCISHFLYNPLQPR